MISANVILTGTAIEVGAKLDKYILHDFVQDNSVQCKYIKGSSIGDKQIEAVFKFSSEDDKKLRKVIGT